MARTADDIELLHMSKSNKIIEGATRTKRENALAILAGEQPDYYFDFMDSLEFAPDPIFLQDVIQPDGQKYLDSWGTEFVWPVGAPGQHPTADPAALVIKDIEEWESGLTVPTLEDLDWSIAQAAAAAVDRNASFLACFSAGGLFERSHHLMSFEEALVNYLLYPDEMAAILRIIADFKLDYIQAVAREFKPDVIFYQDDWGSKTNVFLPPEIWRRLIKPLTKEIVDAAHEAEMLFVLHCDCFAQPLVEDMVEMGVDIWQGVIPQNDIVTIQEITEGKLPMIGGVDGPKIDIENITEEAIRAEVRRAFDEYCPAGRFFPGIANGKCFREWNDSIFRDEMALYGRQWALEHPVV
ncbi:MAG: hypothetical protein LBL23_04470 [Coriobacteriales bacterium]|jgi:hypothetical protein|nr:hypothetical protein [Coriobacteriales bacterium]